MSGRRPTIRAIGRGALLGCMLAVAAPGAAQPPRFEPVGSIPGPADLVELDGERAYVVFERTLSLYDLADPAAPRWLGAYEFPEKIWGFQPVGSHVYVAADFFGLGILDVSDPGAPVLRGAVTTPGQAKGVAVVGSTVAVADHMSGVDFVDLADLAAPVVTGSFYLDGYARDVVAAGSMVYAVDAPTGLYVFDMMADDPMEPVAIDQSATTPSSVETPHPGAGGAPPIICMVGGRTLQVYDVSDPTGPGKAGEIETPGGRPRRVTVRGGLAYVADGPAGLQVVELSTRTAPRIVAAYETPGRALDVAVGEELVLVVVERGEGQEERSGEVLVFRRTR